MRLFAIRKERGEMAIISAENEKSALQRAGLQMEAVASVIAQLQAQGLKINAQTVMREGIGPQRYEIRELTGVCLEFTLDQRGEMAFLDMDSDTIQTVNDMYPIVNAAIVQAVETWTEPVLAEEDRTLYGQFLSAAVERERQRLCIGLALIVQ